MMMFDYLNVEQRTKNNRYNLFHKTKKIKPVELHLMFH